MVFAAGAGEGGGEFGVGEGAAEGDEAAEGPEEEEGEGAGEGANLEAEAGEDADADHIGDDDGGGGEWGDAVVGSRGGVLHVGRDWGNFLGMNGERSQAERGMGVGKSGRMSLEACLGGGGRFECGGNRKIY